MKSRGSLRNTLKTYSNKLKNLEEMDIFLDAFNQPILIQEYINYLNSCMSSNDIKVVIVS
jgi:hypothetical protein